MIQLLEKWLYTFLPDNQFAFVLSRIILLSSVALIGYFLKVISKKFFHNLIARAAAKTKNTFDDHLIESGILRHFYQLIPLILLYFSIWHIFKPGHIAGVALERVLMSVIAIVVILTVNNFLDAVESYYQGLDISRTSPIKSYLQLTKIFLVVMTLVFVISILIDKSPWGIISSIGAMTAIILLIFKDWILGLVASIQINTNDLVNIGDWIEMPQYNADGDIIDISLLNVRVRNFDKTITSIPTYALVAESFINWRGMKETGSRRIKRRIFIDLTSIGFCDDELLSHLRQLNLLKDYINDKEVEIREHNSALGLAESDAFNGRHLTNIGLFRRYVTEYLLKHDKINSSLTMMVRQKEPGEHGLPVEIYGFVNDTVWQNFENVQSDIFDHVFAILPHFKLRLYQSPSGHDIQGLKK